MIALFVAVAVACIAAGLYFSLPGLALAWVVLVVGAFVEPPPPMTGGTTKAPEPTEAEVPKHARHQLVRGVKRHFPFPSALWAPGKDVYASFMAGVLAGWIGFMLPQTPPDYITLDDKQYALWVLLAHVLSGLAAFSFVHVGTALFRARAAGTPGVRLSGLLPTIKAERAWAIMAGVVAVVGIAASLVMLKDRPYGYDASIGAAGSLLAAGLLIGVPWTKRTLGAWRDLEASRAEWSMRWEELKYKPEPTLVKRDDSLMPHVLVETFHASAGLGGSKTMVAQGEKVSPALDAPTLVTYTLNDAGAIDTNLFEIQQWPNGLPDITDADTTLDVARLAINAGQMWACDAGGYGRLMIDDIECITTDDSSAKVWATTWRSTPAAQDSMGSRRVHGTAGLVAAQLHCAAQIDHRAGDSGVMYVGAIGVDGVEYTDPGMAQALANLAIEEEWNDRWADAGPTKHKSNPPKVEHATLAEAELANGTVVKRQGFITRQGVDPTEYFGSEDRLRATLSAAPFVAITGWPSTSGVAGDRHSQAFAVMWANKAVPVRLEQLAPRENAATGTPKSTHPEAWVIAGMMNSAFEKSGLKRPEVVRVRGMSAPRSRVHLWEVELALHGGVTMAKMRAKENDLKTVLGVSWLRMEPTDHGVRLVAGGTPERVTLARPQRDENKLIALDWAQAFSDARVIAEATGALPELVSSTPLEHNDAVTALVFKLPSSLSIDKVKGARAKLQANTGNGFVEISPAPKRTPEYVQLLVAKEHPLPFPAMYDFTAAENSDKIPFAAGIDGQPVCLDFWDGAHLLVAGTQGSGKSVTAQGMLWGARVQGMQVAVVDAQKQAVDFEFLRDHAVGFATSVEDANALMKAIYAEGRRRMDLAAKYKVGHALRVPEHVCPPRLVVFVDEFTSLMGREVVPKTDSNSAPELIAEREAVEFMNRLRGEIGTYTGKIVREWRAAGISLVLGTQKLDATVLGSIPGGADLKDNMARSLFGNPSQGQKQSALREPFDAPDLGDVVPKGRGYWEPLSATRATVIQSWYADQGTEEGKYAPGTFAYELDQRVDKLDASQRLDLEPYRIKQEETAVGIVEIGPDDDSDIIDLGTEEISLDDLEGFTLDDLEDVEAEPVTLEKSDSELDSETDSVSVDDDEFDSGSVELAKTETDTDTETADSQSDSVDSQSQSESEAALIDDADLDHPDFLASLDVFGDDDESETIEPEVDDTYILPPPEPAPADNADAAPQRAVGAKVRIRRPTSTDF